MKRIIITILSLSLLTSVTVAQDLNGFAKDFEALIVGVTRDVAPNLQMTSLSGNIVGDATIDKFMFFLPGIGITVSDGLGTIMKPGAYDWSLVSFPGVIDDQLDKKDLDTIHAIESRFFPYPALKLGFGIALPRQFDIIVSGMYIPEGLTKSLLALGGNEIASLGLSIETFNIGVEVRKTLLTDNHFVPALSIGTLYNYGGFSFSLDNLKLSSLLDEPIEVPGGNLDMNGSMSFSTSVNNLGFDLHVSKHLLFFTPYAKLTGVYQYSETKANTDMTANIGENLNITINTSPTVSISNFHTLGTLGFDLNLYIFILNSNIVFDIARAELDISDFSLTGITGKGVTYNVGLRWQF